MCRVLLTRKKLDLAETLFIHLEKEFGGHGNGLALIKKGKISIEKGTAVTCHELAEKAKNEKYDILVFHTRIASIGSINDDNCHPFVHGDWVIAMNGTESWVRPIAELYNKTDTEVICEILDRAPDADLEDKLRWLTAHTDSVFVGTYKGTPFVVNAGGDLCYWDGIFASSFPAWIPDQQLGIGYTFGDLEKWHPVSKIYHPWKWRPQYAFSNLCDDMPEDPEEELRWELEQVDIGKVHAQHGFRELNYNDGYMDGYDDGYEDGYAAAKDLYYISRKNKKGKEKARS